ncbi:hypothetical protein Q9966_012294 [Columba livia]|nr:hypothetical protein Q9966_012294 [Columba livia]
MFFPSESSLCSLIACQTGRRLHHNVAQGDVQSWGNLLALRAGNEHIYSEVNLCVFRTNIPGNDIQSGKEICRHLPPFPAMGTGCHRFIFLLFKPEPPIDSSEDVGPGSGHWGCCWAVHALLARLFLRVLMTSHSLRLRTLSSFDLCRKQEDGMTPAGLAFQQCQWDSCVPWVSHQLLNRREPMVEFVRPPVYHPPQVKFPHHQPLRTWTDSETPRSPRAAFPRAGPPLEVLCSALAGRAGLILPVF